VNCNTTHYRANSSSVPGDPTKDLDIPVVISYAYSEKSIPSVLFNDEKAAFEMTEYLISKGHKEIAVVTGVEDSIHTKRRFKGFEDAMKKHNLSVNNKIIYHGNWGSESGYQAYKFLEDSKESFTAIFSFNDTMALGLYKALREKNIQVGKDISIAGFDDREFCSFINPELTTMKIPLRDLGLKSAEVLIDLINDKEMPSDLVELECKLIERNSVGTIC